ncbi:MAG: tRNA pseudouridine synthase B [Christensenellales bacterium]
MNGVVNLYKPKGWTSRDAVNKVRSCLGVKRSDTWVRSIRKARAFCPWAWAKRRGFSTLF